MSPWKLDFFLIMSDDLQIYDFSNIKKKNITDEILSLEHSSLCLEAFLTKQK